MRNFIHFWVIWYSRKHLLTLFAYSVQLRTFIVVSNPAAWTADTQQKNLLPFCSHTSGTSFNEFRCKLNWFWKGRFSRSWPFFFSQTRSRVDLNLNPSSLASPKEALRKLIDFLHCNEIYQNYDSDVAEKSLSLITCSSWLKWKISPPQLLVMP